MEQYRWLRSDLALNISRGMEEIPKNTLKYRYFAQKRATIISNQQQNLEDRAPCVHIHGRGQVCSSVPPNKKFC